MEFWGSTFHREDASQAGDIPSTFLPTFFGFLLLGSFWHAFWSKEMKWCAARALYNDLKNSA
jgi:hypothetical protein